MAALDSNIRKIAEHQLHIYVKVDATKSAEWCVHEYFHLAQRRLFGVPAWGGGGTRRMVRSKRLQVSCTRYLLRPLMVLQPDPDMDVSTTSVDLQ